MPTTEFGKPIDLKESNIYFTNLQEIKKRTAAALQFALRDDDVARRYYLSPEAGFVFSKQNMLDFADKLSAMDDTSGVIFYMGSKFDNDRKMNGRPTLMGFVYKKFDEGAITERLSIVTQDTVPVEIIFNANKNFFTKKGDDIEINDADLGREHPGGGGSGKTPISIDVLPTSFPKDAIQTFL